MGLGRAWCLSTLSIDSSFVPWPSVPSLCSSPTLLAHPPSQTVLKGWLHMCLDLLIMLPGPGKGAWVLHGKNNGIWLSRAGSSGHLGSITYKLTSNRHQPNRGEESGQERQDTLLVRLLPHLASMEARTSGLLLHQSGLQLHQSGMCIQLTFSSTLLPHHEQAAEPSRGRTSTRSSRGLRHWPCSSFLGSSRTICSIWPSR